jgi:acyl dehydratase
LTVPSNLKYADLEIGAEYGPFSWKAKSKVVDKYLEAVDDDYPAYHNVEEAQKLGYENKVAPPTLSAIYFLDAYDKAFPTRPPGGIHVKQIFEFYDPPSPDDTLVTNLKIADKYTKRDRFYIKVESITKKENGTLVSEGEMTVIWAK